MSLKNYKKFKYVVCIRTVKQQTKREFLNMAAVPKQTNTVPKRTKVVPNSTKLLGRKKVPKLVATLFYGAFFKINVHIWK